MNILYVSSLLNEASSGGAVVSNSNYNLLKSINQNNNVDYLKVTNYFSKFKSTRKISLILNAILGYSGKFNFVTKYKILRSVKVCQADVIWIDSSLYGQLAVSLKRKYPNKKIICFFHNIEKDFYSYLGIKRSKLFGFIVRSACLNEKLSVSICDALVTLTEKDSQRLYELYAKKASFVLPVTLDMPNEDVLRMNINDKPLLFVGSNFPPNIEAIDFLCKNVMPFTKKKLVIVGKDLEVYRSRYQSDNVDVVGTVDDLSGFYQNSELVLCPIFSGAGMKVKIAEALSYGKKIAGTSFAFAGYDTEGEGDYIFIAETANDYLEILEKNFDSFDPRSYENFIKNHSIPSKKKQLDKFLQEL